MFSEIPSAPCRSQIEEQGGKIPLHDWENGKKEGCVLIRTWENLSK